MIKLRIVKWGDYPRLFKWALNALTSILISGGRGRLYRHRGERRNGKMEQREI